MAHCQKGRSLLLDLKRSEWLPRYDDEGIRSIVEENNELWAKASVLNNAARTDAVKVGLIYHSQCVLRNKRFLDSYFVHRMSKIRRLRWENGAILPSNLQENVLSLDEVEYFATFSKALSDYCEQVGVDLTSSIEPPKDYFIVIRALQDYGEILTESGPLKLVRGTTHYVRRTDVEELIRSGIVEHIKD